MNDTINFVSSNVPDKSDGIWEPSILRRALRTHQEDYEDSWGERSDFTIRSKGTELIIWDCRCFASSTSVRNLASLCRSFWALQWSPYVTIQRQRWSNPPLLWVNCQICCIPDNSQTYKRYVLFSAVDLNKIQSLLVDMRHHDNLNNNFQHGPFASSDHYNSPSSFQYAGHEIDTVLHPLNRPVWMGEILLLLASFCSRLWSRALPASHKQYLCRT